MVHPKKNSASKIYVVFSGKRPGLYYSWSECSPMVIGVKGSIFESFKSYDAAISVFNHFAKTVEGKKKFKLMVFVVFRGKKLGLYKSRSECANMVIGVEGSRFQAFQCYDEAKEAFNEFQTENCFRGEPSSSSIVEENGEVVTKEKAASSMSSAMLVGIFIGMKISENTAN